MRLAPQLPDPRTIEEFIDLAGRSRWTRRLREIERNAAIYRARQPNAHVSVIARVGYDVAASCGMFFGPGGPVAGG